MHSVFFSRHSLCIVATVTMLYCIELLMKNGSKCVYKVPICTKADGNIYSYKTMTEIMPVHIITIDIFALSMHASELIIFQ